MLGHTFDLGLTLPVTKYDSVVGKDGNNSFESAVFVVFVVVNVGGSCLLFQVLTVETFGGHFSRCPRE